MSPGGSSECMQKIDKDDVLAAKLNGTMHFTGLTAECQSMWTGRGVDGILFSTDQRVDKLAAH